MNTRNPLTALLAMEDDVRSVQAYAHILYALSGCPNDIRAEALFVLARPLDETGKRLAAAWDEVTDIMGVRK